MRMLPLSTLLFAPALMAQFQAPTLGQNLRALDCDTVVAVHSDSIRDPIHWSPDSRSIGVKLDGKWISVHLDSLMLKAFKWRDGLNVAKPVGKLNHIPLEDEVRNDWKYAVQEESTLVKTKAGTVVEFKQLGDGWVSLVITLKDGRTREAWRTRLEDCKGLVLSPDERWVAFIAGLHGAVVMPVP